MLKFKNISDNDDYKDELNNCVVIALTEVTNDNFCYNTIKFFVRHVMNRTKNNSVLYGEILGAKKLFKNIELKRNYKLPAGSFCFFKRKDFSKEIVFCCH